MGTTAWLTGQVFRRLISLLAATQLVACTGSTSIREASERAGVTAPDGCCEVFAAGTAQNLLRIFNDDIRFAWHGSPEGREYFIGVLKDDRWTLTSRETAFTLVVDEVHVGDFRRGLLDKAAQIAARQQGIPVRLIAAAAGGALVTHYMDAMGGYVFATNTASGGRLPSAGVPEEAVLANRVPKRVAILQAASSITPMGIEIVVADYAGTVPEESLRRMAIHGLLQKMKLAR